MSTNANGDKKGSRKRKSTEQADQHPLAKAIKDALTCPITHSLVVRPVTAEDGNTYEHDAIQTWLRSKRRSPLTNAPMGDKILDSRKSRDLVKAAIASGAVDAADAAAWHVGSARQMASGGISGGIAGAKEHLEKAPESSETKLLLRAVTLRMAMDDIARRGDDLAREASAAGVAGVEAFLGGARAAPADPTVMKEWSPNIVGRKVRIIDDLETFRRLCDETAPGASESVGWDEAYDDDDDEGMAALCGKVWSIESCDEPFQGYTLRTANYMVPFNTCILLPPSME